MKNFVIIPVVTEKSLAMAAQNVYQFLVPTWANKGQITTIITDQFKVTVTGITTARLNGTARRFRQKSGVTAITKKATVTLKKGQSISDFSMPVETAKSEPASDTTQSKAVKPEPKTESTITVRSKSKKAQ